MTVTPILVVKVVVVAAMVVGVIGLDMEKEG